MRILLIEDALQAGDFMLKGLRELGYAVDLARSGAEGVRLAAGQSYSVILADGVLADREELMRALRCAAVRKPVMFLTGIGGLAGRRPGVAGGSEVVCSGFMVLA